MNRTMLLLAIALSPLPQTALGADPPRQELRAGHVQLALTPRRGGLRVTSDGLEVIRHSDLVITTPPWAPHYYVGPTADAVAAATHSSDADGEHLRITHPSEKGDLEAVETLTLRPDGTLVQTLEARLLRDNAEALIQWRMAALNPTLLIGRSFEATLADGASVRETVPVTPRGSELKDTRLVQGFRTLRFDGRSGPLEIEVLEAPGPLIVYDFRRDKWASPQDPYFWFGDLGTRFKNGETVRYQVIYRFPPARDAGAGPAVVRGEPALSVRADAQTWPQEAPLLIPRPKECAFSTSDFVLGRVLPGGLALDAFAIAADQIDEAEQAAAQLRRELQDRAPLFLRKEHTNGKEPFIVFDRADPGLLPAAEAYALTVSAERVTIAATDSRGYQHAVRTLVQLLHQRPDGTLVFRGAKIRDWPSLPLRGVHLFTGGKGPALHEKLLRRVIGALKMNHLVLESEYIEWDSAPEIHHPEYGMPKDEVRQILAVCREQGLEVTPLVMALGHAQWMFTNDQNLDLAEDPEAKWAYCVTNPRTYEFLFAIYTEALELFKPRMFHIGHDEFHHRGRWPYREATQALSLEQIFTQDTLKLHGWLAERGVRTMMWGDILLAKGEAPDATHAESAETAARLRTTLPNDIVIADWHYIGVPPEKYTSLKLFQEAGKEVLAATWSQPRNIVNFARAAHAAGALGLLQTTWAGYSLDETSFAKELHQYAAYVLAAEAAWNADNPSDPDAYPTGALFLDLMGMSRLRPANRAGWTADLRAVYNYARSGGGARGWFALGPDHDLSALPAGTPVLKGITFDLGPPETPDDQPGVLVLRSKLVADAGLPATVELALGHTAAQLVLLHATNFACEVGAEVAQLVVTYVDGQPQTVPLVYGRHTFAYTDLNAAAEAPLVWTDKTPAGAPVGLRALIWDNPRPDVPLAALTIRSSEAAGGLMVVGLTGLEREPTGVDLQRVP